MAIRPGPPRPTHRCTVPGAARTAGRPSPLADLGHRPHTAAVRPYWLCHIFKEPGAERTPFNDPGGDGWEDDLTHPREAGELVSALQSTWTIVEDCLDRWTPAMLQDEFHREINGQVQLHTRQSVLMRLLTHDAYHCGEIAQTLGMHGLQEVDIWTGRVPLLADGG